MRISLIPLLMRKRNDWGFTMIEIIIVLIIIGIMASLSFVRFFRTVEYARATEALASLNAIRLSMERCYMQRNSFTPCNVFSNLDLEDPGGAVNTHFSYSFVSVGTTAYTIRATRNTRDGGTSGDQITLDNDGAVITRSGTGAFASIQ